MGSLPKYASAKPTIVWADLRLTIAGGDVRDDAMQDILDAMLVAFDEQASKHGLDSCFSRVLRSTDSRRLRKRLITHGFKVPLEPPPSDDAVREDSR